MTVENRVKIVNKLITKSEKNLEEAHLLFEKEFYEAAISRAYYSMFHLAQAVLATKDIKRCIIHKLYRKEDWFAL